MPRLLDSICSVIAVFYKYSKMDGDCFTLNRRELKKMIRKEFSEVLQNPHDPQAVEFVLQLLDLNEDCLVDLNEFLILVFQVAKACYGFLQPPECLPQREEARGDRCDRDQQSDERVRREPRDNGEERGGSDQVHPRPADSSTRREERRENLTPFQRVGQTNERSRHTHNLESRDDRGRLHQSREAREWGDYEGSPRNSEPQADVETHQRPWEPEPQRNEPWHHQPRERELIIEEEPQHLPRDLEPRDSRHRPSYEFQSPEDNRGHYSQEPLRRVGHDRPQEPGQQAVGDSLRRPHELELQAYKERRCLTRAPGESRYGYGRCLPSREPHAWLDGRREGGPRGDIRHRPYDLDPHVDEGGHYQTHGHESVDDYEEPHPLPRAGGRWEPEAREDYKRGWQYYAPESRRGEEWRPRSIELDPREHNRRQPQPSELEPRGDDWRSQEDARPKPQWIDRRRTGPHDAEPREEERRRPQIHEAEEGEREGRRPHNTEPSERDRRRPREAEPSEGDRRRPHKAEPTEGDRRRPREAESSEGDRRRPHEAEPTEGDRRMPREAEPSEGDRRRPHEAEPTERDRRMPREAKPSEGDRRRPHEAEPSRGERRRPREVEPSDGVRRRPQEPREEGHRRQLYYEPEPLETDSKRRRSQRYESEGERRRPQSSEDEPREEQERRPQPNQARPRDDDRKRPQSREPLAREDIRRQSHPRNSDSREDERSQSHEPESRELESAWSEVRDPRKDESRSQYYYERKPREREHDRYETESRDIGWRAHVLHKPECIYYEQIYYECESREDEQSRAQIYNPEKRVWERRRQDPRSSELYDVRQPQPSESESRQDGRRRRHVPREPESREAEMSYYAKGEGRESRIPSRDVEPRENDQRRTQSHRNEFEDGEHEQLPEEDSFREDEQRISRSDQKVPGDTKNAQQQVYDQDEYQQHESEPREREWTRSHQYTSEADEAEQRRSQQPEGAPREAEQRRSQKPESDQRETDQRRSQPQDERKRLQPTEPESSAYAQQRQQLCTPKAEESDLGRPPQPPISEFREDKQRDEKLRESGPSQNVQTGQGEQASPLPQSREVERSQTRRPESQRSEQRRRSPQEPRSRTQQNTEEVQRPQSGEPKSDPGEVVGVKGSKLVVSEGIQEQPGTPEPEQSPVPDASGGEGSGQSAPMEADGSSLKVRELQPPLEEENQPATKTLLHAGPSESSPEVREPKASQEKPKILSEAKVPFVSNPLYEYLVAQKK